VPEYKDLCSVVGRVVRPPTTKTVSGDKQVTELKVSQQLSYGQGEGDYGKTRLVTVSVWGDYGEKIEGEIIKGQVVTAEGIFKKEDGEYADFSAFRVGPTAFIAKRGSATRKAPESDDSLDF